MKKVTNNKKQVSKATYDKLNKDYEQLVKEYHNNIAAIVSLKEEYCELMEETNQLKETIGRLQEDLIVARTAYSDLSNLSWYRRLFGQTR